MANNLFSLTGRILNSSEFETLAEADSFAFTNNYVLSIDKNWTLSANTTLIAKAVVSTGGVITTNGFNLTMNLFDAPLFKAFDTTGFTVGTFTHDTVRFQGPYQAAWFGQIPDGATQNNDVSINSCINSAAAAATVASVRPRTVELLTGVTLTNAPIILQSQVDVDGLSWYECHIRLVPGSNCNVFQTINFEANSTLNSTTPAGNYPTRFSLKNLKIEGQGPSQTLGAQGQGMGLAIYGYSFTLDRINIYNTVSVGCYLEFQGSGPVTQSDYSDGYIPKIGELNITQCLGGNFVYRGPGDAQMSTSIQSGLSGIRAGCTVVNGGSGYTASTTLPVVFSNGGTGTAVTNSSGVITGVNVDTLGAYSSNITVSTINGSAPLGATNITCGSGQGTGISHTWSNEFSLQTTGTTNGTAIVTALGSTTGVLTGMIARGQNIPGGTIVASVDSSTQVTLSNVTTGSTVGGAIVFSLPIWLTGRGMSVDTGPGPSPLSPKYLSPCQINQVHIYGGAGLGFYCNSWIRATKLEVETCDGATAILDSYGASTTSQASTIDELIVYGANTQNQKNVVSVTLSGSQYSIPTFDCRAENPSNTITSPNPVTHTSITGAYNTILNYKYNGLSNSTRTNVAVAILANNNKVHGRYVNDTGTNSRAVSLGSGSLAIQFFDVYTDIVNMSQGISIGNAGTKNGIITALGIINSGTTGQQYFVSVAPNAAGGNIKCKVAYRDNASSISNTATFLQSINLNSTTLQTFSAIPHLCPWTPLSSEFSSPHIENTQTYGTPANIPAVFSNVGTPGATTFNWNVQLSVAFGSTATANGYITMASAV